VVALDAYCDSVAIGSVGLLISSRIAGHDTPWQAAVEDSVRREFGSEPGRRWLRSLAAEFDESFGMKALQCASGDNYRSATSCCWQMTEHVEYCANPLARKDLS